MVLKHYTFLLLSCLLVISSASVVAETADRHEDLFSMSLEQLVKIQVTSSTLTKKAQKLVPASVTVFSQEQIRNLGAEYLHELINFVPGFQSFRQGESSVEYFHSARGHRTSVSSREVLILIDGVRLNREFDNALSVPMLALNNVEKIEFIRGPGSALYGSNAYLGVIDITTSTARKELTLLAGDDDKAQLGALATAVLDNWQLDAAVNVFDEAGQKLPLQNFYTLERESGRDPRAGHDIHLSAQNGGFYLGAKYFERTAEDFYITERTSQNYNEVEHRHQHLQLRQKLNWTEDFSSEFSASYSESFYFPKAFFAQGGFNRIKAEQEESNTGVQVHNDWRTSENRSYQFGVDYRYSDLPAFLFYTESATFPMSELYPESTQEILSGYVQAQHKFGSGAELIFGARYDDYNNIGSALSPRFSLVAPITNHQTLKFLYGEAFRAPTVNELSLQTFTGSVQGNPDLNPETIKTWELIWLGQWQDFRMSVNTFYNVMEDTIVKLEDPSTEFRNLQGEESFYGAEIEFAFQVFQDWLISANASNFQNLPQADYREAKWLGSLIVNYHHRQWNLNFSSTYAGEREMLANNKLLKIDEYWLFNTKLQYALDKHLNLFVSVDNIFDEDYKTPVDRPNHTEPFANRGREFSLGFNYRFN